jgi:hypothetical protein
MAKNNPNLAGQQATPAHIYGGRRYAVYGVHTTGEDLEWVVVDAETPDEQTGLASVVRREPSREGALAALSVLMLGEIAASVSNVLRWVGTCPSLTGILRAEALDVDLTAAQDTLRGGAELAAAALAAKTEAMEAAQGDPAPATGDQGLSFREIIEREKNAPDPRVIKRQAEAERDRRRAERAQKRHARQWNIQPDIYFREGQ